MQGILNRRYLRVKVFQALYAYHQSNKELDVVEKNMLKSINQSFDLLLYELALILEVVEMARRNMEQNKGKQLPTDADLNPNLRFVNNKLIAILESNEQLSRAFDRRKINWAMESDNVKKLWRKIRDSKQYLAYMESSENSFEADKNVIVQLFKLHIAEYEPLHHYLEDQSIYWLDDLRIICANVVKLIEEIPANSTPVAEILPSLYKDEADDIRFVKDLLRKSVLKDEDYAKYIEDKTVNWEVDRIVKLDVILMKMALVELLDMPSIPVKVTLNEYIELAKNYSTPNSKNFINGILDKLVAEFKSNGKLVKTGRGLIE